MHAWFNSNAVYGPGRSNVIFLDKKNPLSFLVHVMIQAFFRRGREGMGKKGEQRELTLVHHAQPSCLSKTPTPPPFKILYTCPLYIDHL